MLKARILTAIVVLPLFLLALFYLQDIFWAAFLLALTVIGSREWSPCLNSQLKTQFFLCCSQHWWVEVLFY